MCRSLAAWFAQLLRFRWSACFYSQPVYQNLEKRTKRSTRRKELDRMGVWWGSSEDDTLRSEIRDLRKRCSSPSIRAFRLPAALVNNFRAKTRISISADNTSHHQKRTSNLSCLSWSQSTGPSSLNNLRSLYPIRQVSQSYLQLL